MENISNFLESYIEILIKTSKAPRPLEKGVPVSLSKTDT